MNASLDTSPAPARPRLVVWLVTDGKAGHRSQLEGLLRALMRSADVNAHWLSPQSRTQALLSLLLRRFTPGQALPAPDLVIGAGHSTHLTVMAARRAHRATARSIVLMQPSLPSAWFDLCVIPQHDKPLPRANVIATRGVLNTARASMYQKPAQGLFLIGGPSKHHDWDEKTLLTQIRQVVKETPDMRWALTTSRRTPQSTTQLLAALRRVGVEVIPLEKTDPGWVIDAITVSSQVWVTEDSVSMIFESLTSGAATGLLWVPRKDKDRITEGVEQLVKDGMATTFLDWQQSKALVKQAVPMNEADRVADAVIARFCVQDLRA
jgi:mitochondrial fission protein ELM1